jgi:hypothetical protein
MSVKILVSQDSVYSCTCAHPGPRSGRYGSHPKTGPSPDLIESNTGRQRPLCLFLVILMLRRYQLRIGTEPVSAVIYGPLSR